MTVTPAMLKIAIADSPADLEQCYAIRLRVFVEEQQVPPELELDEYDASAFHYLALTDDLPIATARIVDKHGSAKIGRVAVLPEYRGFGHGKTLMEFLLSDAAARGFREAMLDAQTHALDFYARLGFVAEGDEFLDAGIPHFRMRRSLGPS